MFEPARPLRPAEPAAQTGSIVVMKGESMNSSGWFSCTRNSRKVGVAWVDHGWLLGIAERGQCGRDKLRHDGQTSQIDSKLLSPLHVGDPVLAQQCGFVNKTNRKFLLTRRG